MDPLKNNHDALPPPIGEQAQSAHEAAPDQMEPPPSKPPIMLSPANDKITGSPEDAHEVTPPVDYDTPCQSAKGKRTRNRLSAAERKMKADAVASDYRGGHPLLAIMLRNRLNKSQLDGILTALLLDGTLTPILSDYEILPATQVLKNIRGLGVSADGYVRVTKTETGIALTPYIPEEEEYE